jgi:hypothetical protein
MSENRETGWWMVQSAANHSLRANSLIIRENTGNFVDLGRFWNEPSGKARVVTAFFGQFPNNHNREF